MQKYAVGSQLQPGISTVALKPWSDGNIEGPAAVGRSVRGSCQGVLRLRLVCLRNTSAGPLLLTNKILPKIEDCLLREASGTMLQLKA